MQRFSSGLGGGGAVCASCADSGVITLSVCVGDATDSMNGSGWAGGGAASC